VQYVLKHIESKYKDEPSPADVANGSAHRPGYKLFRRIKAARATKDKEILDTFLDNLKRDITRHCSDIRREHAAELDAESTDSPQRALPIENQGSVNSSPLLRSSDAEQLGLNGSLPNAIELNTDTRSTTEDSDTSSASSSTEDPEQESTTETESRSPSPVTIAPGVKASRMHVYTDILYSHASNPGIKTQVIRTTTRLPQGWQCTIKFGDIEKSAIAENKKTAGHIAARLVCQELGLIE
jgi:hypothetical protein